MAKDDKRKHGDDLRAAASLLVHATTGVTNVVRDMHYTIASGPSILGRPLRLPARLITRLAYGNVSGVTRIVGVVLDRVLEELGPFLGESAPGPQRELVLSALNGVVGDWLAETKNPLAIELELRHPEPKSGKHLVLFVHGSSMGARGWLRRGHDHGASLERDLGIVPIYAHYNTGRHISANGSELADALEALALGWNDDVERIDIIAHSMGGLVARSACHLAEARKHAWRRKVAKLVTLGTPHHGSPLERGGSFLDAVLGVSSYSAPLARLGKIRSAGVTDLRFGYVLDEHWQGSDRFELGADGRRPLPLPEGVRCYALAAEKDVLVPVPSAHGKHAEEAHLLAFDAERCAIAEGLGHLDLLDDASVYTTLRRWIEE